jgi:hypothetical protein
VKDYQRRTHSVEFLNAAVEMRNVWPQLTPISARADTTDFSAWSFNFDHWSKRHKDFQVSKPLFKRSDVEN